MEKGRKTCKRRDYVKDFKIGDFRDFFSQGMFKFEVVNLRMTELPQVKRWSFELRRDQRIMSPGCQWLMSMDVEDSKSDCRR